VKVPVSITINGRRYERDVEPRLLLVHFIRDLGALTGTHVGCDTSQCGACTVLLDGAAVKSCTCLTVQADGAEVTTIEGLATLRTQHDLPAGTKVALESGTVAFFVARQLAALGLEPVVVDAAEVRAKATRPNQKSDRRDARELCLRDRSIRRVAYYRVDEDGRSRLLLSYANPDAVVESAGPSPLAGEEAMPRRRRTSPPPQPPGAFDRAYRWVAGLFYA